MSAERREEWEKRNSTHKKDIERAREGVVPEPMLLVITMMVFLKSTFLPWLSVNTPSSIICSRRFDTYEVIEDEKSKWDIKNTQDSSSISDTNFFLAHGPSLSLSLSKWSPPDAPSRIRQTAQSSKVSSSPPQLTSLLPHIRRILVGHLHMVRVRNEGERERERRMER
jgi:hypothetical protein